MSASLGVEHLSVAYRGSVAIRDLSFAVPPGGCTALVGANGAGKTSLLRGISGLVKTGSRTSIRLDGEEIGRLDAARRARRGLGHVLENRHLFVRMTVAENLELGAAIAPDSRRHGIDRAMRLLPELHPLLERTAETLSGGQQQFVAIARSVAAEPKVLLLDEPTNGLAPRLVERVVEIVEELGSEGTTVVLVEQRLEVASAVADDVYVIGHGEILHRTYGNDENLARLAHEAYLA